MKIRIKILIAFVSLLVVGVGLLNYFGPRMIIEINNVIITTFGNNSRITDTPSGYNLNSEQIYIKTTDGLKLSGFVIRTDSSNKKGTILLVHGIRGNKEHFLPICKLLADNGFNSVIIDLRAHGESEGKYCTFGYKEKQDLKILIDSLELIKDLNRNYGIWGQSLGAAVALQTLEIDKRIRYGIIESTFSDFKTIVHDYSRNRIGFNFPILNNYLINRAEKIGEFKSEEIVPSESVKRIFQPILMVHGKKDKRIKFEYGLKNFKNLASTDKEFLAYKDANHLKIWEVGGDEYFEKVIDFLNRMTKQ